MVQLIGVGQGLMGLFGKVIGVTLYVSEKELFSIIRELIKLLTERVIELVCLQGCNGWE